MTNEIETLQQALETALMERDVARRQVEGLEARLALLSEEVTTTLQPYRQHQASREAVILAAKVIFSIYKDDWKWSYDEEDEYYKLFESVEALEKMEGGK